MDRNKLQNLLDSLDEGPLGKPQSYWNLVENLSTGRHLSYSKEILEKRSRNINYINSRLKRGDRPAQMRPILAYKVYSQGSGRNYKEISREFVGEFESIWKASEELNVKRGDISNVLGGRQKNTKGYTFKYVNND